MKWFLDIGLEVAYSAMMKSTADPLLPPVASLFHQSKSE